jgi:hypothetical protein
MTMSMMRTTKVVFETGTLVEGARRRATTASEVRARCSLRAVTTMTGATTKMIRATSVEVVPRPKIGTAAMPAVARARGGPLCRATTGTTTRRRTGVREMEMWPRNSEVEATTLTEMQALSEAGRTQTTARGGPRARLATTAAPPQGMMEVILRKGSARPGALVSGPLLPLLAELGSATAPSMRHRGVR